MASVTTTQLQLGLSFRPDKSLSGTAFGILMTKKGKKKNYNQYEAFGFFFLRRRRSLGGDEAEKPPLCVDASNEPTMRKPCSSSL
jgi:hypothetical protein